MSDITVAVFMALISSVLPSDFVVVKLVTPLEYRNSLVRFGYLVPIFNNLKKLEDEKGFSEAITKKGSEEKIKFFNLGKDNDYRKLLNENLINKMNNLFQEELVKYNYE